MVQFLLIVMADTSNLSWISWGTRIAIDDNITDIHNLQYSYGFKKFSFAKLANRLSRTGELRISTALESQSDAIYLEADYYQINLPKRKIFDKEAEYHTESVALPAGVKHQELQQEINSKEAEGYTYVNSISTKNNVFLFFKK